LPCTVVVGNQRFGRPWQHDPSKRWHPTTIQHGVTTQKTTNSTYLYIYVLKEHASGPNLC